MEPSGRTHRKPTCFLRPLIALLLMATLVVAAQSARPAAAFHNAGLVFLSSHQFVWIDPQSGGRVEIVEEVFEGCSDRHEHEMTFQYVVANHSYDPLPGISNGFSGFQIIFPGPVPELHHQLSPDDPRVSTTGATPLPGSGPWIQNAFSGAFPPFGVEWDAPGPLGRGIMPGEIGTFSFCTDEREDLVVNDPPPNPFGQGPYGWAHTWLPVHNGDPCDEGDVIDFCPDGNGAPPLVCLDTFPAGQACIFNGPISVPGEKLFVLDIACSDGHVVCKKVKYLDRDRDGIIEVGEPVRFLEVIQVHNPSAGAWTGTKVEDRWGAEIDVTSATPSQGTATLTTTGASAKEHLLWSIGGVPPGGVATLVLHAETDLNPAGHQEYTTCGVYEFNSGAVLKFLNPEGKQRSFETGGIFVRVPCDD